MTTANVPPARDPANDDSLVGYTKELKRWLLKNLDVALPAVVLRHDRANNRVRVRPLITKIDSTDQTLRRSEIQSIPVLNLGGGGFFINFHLPVGQQGMIMALDRDISLFLQSQQESRPNTDRMHAFNDSIFVPQQWFDYVIDEEDSEAMVIQNLDGSVKIALDETSIRVVKDSVRAVFTSQNITMDAPGSIDFTANTISMTAPGGVTINNVTFDAAGAVESPVSFTAPNLIGTTDVTFGGISGTEHTHPQEDDSGGNTEQDTGAPN